MNLRLGESWGDRCLSCGHARSYHNGIANACKHLSHNPSTHEDRVCVCRAFYLAPKSNEQKKWTAPMPDTSQTEREIEAAVTGTSEPKPPANLGDVTITVFNALKAVDQNVNRMRVISAACALLGFDPPWKR